MKQISDEIYEKFILRVKPLLPVINKNKKIVVAVSGGPDSMFLLFLTYKFSLKNKIEVIPVYINHNVRSKNEIKKDIEIIKSFCEKYGLKLNIKKIKPKRFDENTLRQLRYEKLIDFAKKNSSYVIFTGHTQDDLVETFLINLLRGAGVKGLCSITPLREIVFEKQKFYILRPIIDISKKQILDVLNKLKISYSIDSTNLNINYARNFLRNKILPLFRKINPSFEKNIINSIELLNYTNNLILELLDVFFKSVVKQKNNKVYIELNKFLMYKDTIKQEVIYRIFSEILRKHKIHLKQGYKKTVEKILNFLESKKKFLVINKYIEIKKNKNKLCINLNC